jgi:hypothetical protein
MTTLDLVETEAFMDGHWGQGLKGYLETKHLCFGGVG